jgi:hypothetical protein
VRLTKTRELDLPEGFEEDLSEIQMQVLLRLQEIEAAGKEKTVPPFIVELAEKGDARAISWIERFKGGPRKGAPVRERDERVDAVEQAVDKCIRQLVEDGALELEEDSHSELVEQVLQTMLKSRSGDKAVRAAVATVLDSPFVAEVFADDSDLQKAFRKALGGLVPSLLFTVAIRATRR